MLHNFKFTSIKSVLGNAFLREVNIKKQFHSYFESPCPSIEVNTHSMKQNAHFPPFKRF